LSFSKPTSSDRLYLASLRPLITCLSFSKSRTNRGWCVGLRIRGRSHQKLIAVLRIDREQDRIDLRFHAVVPFLGLRRAPVQLRGLRPAKSTARTRTANFKRVAQHLDGLTPELHRFAVVLLLLDVGEPAEDPVTAQRDEEESKCDLGKAVAIPKGMVHRLILHQTRGSWTRTRVQQDPDSLSRCSEVARFQSRSLSRRMEDQGCARR
jgi:hypothetical protein